MYSVLVPTVGNFKSLDFLRLMVSSLEKNSIYDFEVLVWGNGVYNETSKFCKEHAKIKYFESNENLGLSIPYKTMAVESKFDYLFFADDDYYFLPEWDKIFDEITSNGIVRTTMRIENRGGDKGRGVNGNYGTHVGQFNEEALLNDFRGFVYPNRRISNFLPYAMLKEDYFNIDGHSPELFTSEMVFIWKTYEYCTLKLKQPVLTCPISFIYHFLHGTSRPYNYVAMIDKQCKYFDSKFNISSDELDKVTEMWKYYGPSFDEFGNLIMYGSN